MCNNKREQKRRTKKLIEFHFQSTLPTMRGFFALRLFYRVYFERAFEKFLFIFLFGELSNSTYRTKRAVYFFEYSSARLLFDLYKIAPIVAKFVEWKLLEFSVNSFLKQTTLNKHKWVFYVYSFAFNVSFPFFVCISYCCAV